jgi:two-component system, cell cycle sensor histidine kinase and response regulator CckA
VTGQTILVVEDNPITRKMLRVTLETEHFSVVEAEDGTSALALVASECPALVLQDFVLPDMNGAQLLKEIRRLHDVRALPVVLLTGLASKAAEFADDGGFTAVLSKPVEPSRLLEIVRSLLAEPTSTPRGTTHPFRRVLVVDDDAGNRRLSDARLTLAGYKPTSVASAEDALREARRERPDVILGDVLMPGLDGFQLCLAARRDPDLASVPIVLVSSAYTDESDRKLALQVGASDLVLRTPGLEQAIAAIEAAFAPGARPAARSGSALDQEYLASLRRQVDRQLAHTEELARRAGIQAAALSMVGALAQALANPREVSAVLGDVLVHCLDAAGLSTGILYLRGPDGALRVHSMAGVPETMRARANAEFAHPELLDALNGEGPVAFSSATGTSAHQDFLAQLERTSALIVPFVVLGKHYGTLVLASDVHDLADVAWGTFARALAAQFGQAVALGRSLSELAESDALLRSAVDASPNGMIMADAAGRIVLANRQVEKKFGYGHGELAGKQVEALLPERYRGGHAGQRGGFMADPQARPMGAGRELFALHKDGHEFPVEIGLAPVKRGGEYFVIASVVDITRRRKTEERIRWLSLAVEQGPTSVVMTDLEGKIEYVNPKFTEVTGYSLDDVRGKTPRILKSGQTPPETYRALWNSITSGRPWHGELLNKKKDGTAYWDAVWVYPIRDGSGAVTRFLALKEDITARRNAEQALHEREERFSQLAENIKEVFFLQDAQYHETIYINKAYERIWGRSTQSLYQNPQSFVDPIPEEDRGALFASIEKNRQGEYAGDVEFRVVRPDGEVRWVMAHAVPVRNDKGQVYRIAGVCLDVTERRKAEESLRESERRARTLFETVNLIVLGLDPKGHVEYANPFLLKTLGYAADEVLGKSWFDFLPAAQRAGMHGVFTELLEREFHPHYENPIVTKTGEERMIAWNNTVLRDLDGRPTGTLSIGEDITERNRLEVQLRQAQKMEAIGRLAGGVAHDFNNVLTAVFGYVDLLREELTDNASAQKDLAEVRKAAERAAGLTRQLLAFSRQQVLEPIVLEPNDLLQDFEKMLRRVIGEDVELRLTLGKKVGNVRADPGQLNQVVMNLVVNARDAMPKGGTLILETANADLTEQYAELHQPVIPGPYVMLAVSDTGTGMPPEVKARIFEPFFTTKEKGKGTGLGLSTVYGIVKQSGGYVWVYTEPGRGTTFKIYLPRVDAPADATPRPKDSRSLAGTETILLAEDDAMLRPLAKGLLEKLGYLVLEAENATEALAKATAHRGTIHLLVADVVMPGRSGRELARTLATTRPDTRVLYVSGYTDDAIVHHGMLEPGLNFLQKPFTPAVLARRVREVLDAKP